MLMNYLVAVGMGFVAKELTQAFLPEWGSFVIWMSATTGCIVFFSWLDWREGLKRRSS